MRVSIYTLMNTKQNDIQKTYGDNPLNTKEI